MVTNMFFVVWQNACTDKCTLWLNKQQPRLIWTKVLCFIFSGHLTKLHVQRGVQQGGNSKNWFPPTQCILKATGGRPTHCADIHEWVLKGGFTIRGIHRRRIDHMFLFSRTFFMNTNQMWNFCPTGSFSILVSFSCKELDNKLKTQTVSKGKCWVHTR